MQLGQRSAEVVSSVDESQLDHACTEKQEEEHQDTCWQSENEFVELHTKCERQAMGVATNDCANALKCNNNKSAENNQHQKKKQNKDVLGEL